MRFPTTHMCSGAILEAFEPTTRDTDLFCSTAAKSGQTWLLALLHHLKTRGHDPDLGGLGLRIATPWLEIPRSMQSGEDYDPIARIAEFETLGDPRIFKLHVLYEEIPRRVGSGAKIITITRDPRDLPYSMFCHLQGLRPEIRQSEVSDDFDEYFDQWMEFGYVFKFVHSFWPHRHDADLLWLRFADLKSDLARESRKIVAFTAWPVSEEDIARAIPLVDFRHMQKTERTTLMTTATRAWTDESQFFREGAIGKNRARLSKEQEERIIARARREFEPKCFDFVFSQGV